MGKKTLSGLFAVAMLLGVTTWLGAHDRAPTEEEIVATPPPESGAADAVGGLCEVGASARAKPDGGTTMEAIGIGDIIEMAPCPEGSDLCTAKCDIAAARCEATCSGCPFYFTCFCTSPPCQVNSHCDCFYPCNP